MMNFWTPSYEVWANGFIDFSMPWQALYDYVEVYSFDEDTLSFDLLWRDDFNYFDETRWKKSDNKGITDNTTTFFKE